MISPGELLKLAVKIKPQLIEFSRTHILFVRPDSDFLGPARFLSALTLQNDSLTVIWLCREHNFGS
jgi:hypothetical protein